MSAGNDGKVRQPLEGGPEHEAEPQGGPLERDAEFLDERTTPMRPKDEPEPAAPPEPVPDDDQGMPEDDTSVIESRIDPDFRRRVIEEYRKRRGEQTDRSHPPAPDEHAGGPPQPPTPPPANNWVPIGPSVVRQGQGGVKPATSGRTPAIAVAPGGSTIFIGAANGGVWRSTNAGDTWQSLMEAFDLNPTTPASDSLSVGALAIDHSNPSRLFVGSGEGPGAAYFGVGPIVTTNATAAAPIWTTENAAAGSPSLAGTAFYALAMDPNNADRVIAATYRGLYRREPAVSGFEWARKTLGGIATERVTSVVATTSGGATTFYAAQRNGLIYSSPNGDVWSIAGAGFPTGLGRIALASRPDDPSVVYALASDGTVRRLATIDGTWRNISGVPAGFLGSQGWYDLAIAVAPDDANRVYLGGSTVSSGGDWSGSLYRGEVTVAGSTVSMTSTYIGGSIHADVHTIVFAPGDATKMWVGCDGGVFYSTNPTGSGDIFDARNTGLQTLTMEYLAQHPDTDAVLFGGTQDNGCLRFTGEEAWLYSAGGDGGFEVVDWNDPYRVLSSYVYGCIRRSTNGGQRYSYVPVNVPMVNAQCSPLENCLFYAPLVGTPPNPGSPTAAADAALVAFGSIRPWISTTFGGSWTSIPSGALAGDSLDERIRALKFASADRLYAGTMGGGVYRFDRSGATWTRTQIDTLGGVNQLPLAAPVTDITVDPADAGRIWVTLGGTGDWRHVWYFDGSQWLNRSGPAAGNVNSLLDIFAGALVADPAHPTHLYLGADIGIWRSVDGGQNWQAYADGLPDAAVTDLVLHPIKRVLRAATHGRGVWERTLPDGPKQGVELYVRSTQLDLGRSPVVNGLPDPTAPGETVRFWRAPDIKLDTPDAGGQYQFPLTGSIDFLKFVDTLSDDFQNVATHATANIVTRVYVQLHNRGVIAADNVRVMLLLARASAGLPALPAGFDANVRNGLPINTPDWKTVGIQTVDDVRVGFPKVARFDLPSSMLPTPANLAGNQHQCVLALVHHADDQFTNSQTVVDVLSRDDRKAAHKNLSVVQFTGTLPPEMPIVVPFRICNALAEERLSDLHINFGKFTGRVRLLVPSGLAVEQAFEGLRRTRPDDGLKRWAADWFEELRRGAHRKHRFDRHWSKEAAGEFRALLDNGHLLEAVERSEVAIRGIDLAAQSSQAMSLIFDRPTDSQDAGAFPIEISQFDARANELIGGLSVRIEIVTGGEPEPPSRGYRRHKTIPGVGAAAR